MNVYNGNVMLDDAGEAVITMPDWFEPLNRDFRYQLTCIGGFAQVFIAKEMSNSNFKIAGGKPGIKVSWQVTGIRQDPFAEQNRIQVEVEKEDQFKGYYIHTDVYNMPEEKSHNYVMNGHKTSDEIKAEMEKMNNADRDRKEVINKQID